MDKIEFDEYNESITYTPGKPNITVSGRSTSPAPSKWNGELTNRKATSFLSREARWLALEGNTERELRGLVSPVYDGKNLSTSDMAEIFHYLGDPEWLDIHG